MNDIPSLVSSASASACALASATCRESGTSGSTALTSSAGEVPSSAWIEMPS